MKGRDQPIILILIRCTSVGDKIILGDEIAHLTTFDLVPPFNEVLHDVKNNGAIDGHVHLSLCVSLRREKEYNKRLTSCHGMRGDSSTEIVSLT